MNVDQRPHPLRLAAAGVQACAYSWFVVAVLGVFAYVMAADSPVLGELTWRDAGSVATGWWLTSLGGSLHVNGVIVSLPPLLITLATFGAALFFVRRLPLADWKDVAVLAASGAVTVALIGLLAPPGSETWPAAGGAAALLALASICSTNRADWFSVGVFRTRGGRVLYDATMLSRRALALLAILATAGLIAITVINVSEIRVINDFYIVSAVDRILLWAFQIAYLPTYLLWAAAFLVGAGFAVGAGTDFSALSVTAAPLPGIPILGALPGPGGTYWPTLAVVVAVVFAYGWWQSSSFPTPQEALLTGGAQVVVTGFVMAVAGAMSSGGIGPGRMTVVGPQPPEVAAWSILTIALPLLAGIMAGHRRSRAAYAAWFSSAMASTFATLTDTRGRLSEARQRRSEARRKDAAGEDAGADIPHGDACGAGAGTPSAPTGGEPGAAENPRGGDETRGDSRRDGGGQMARADWDVATAPIAPDFTPPTAASPEDRP